MRVTVSHTKLPIAPRKLRAVLGQLRHRLVPEALALMLASNRTTTEPIRKLLLASISAAHDRNPALRPEELSVDEIYAGEGIRQYRTRRKSRGRSARYAKRGSNLTLVVSWSDASVTTATHKKAVSTSKDRVTRYESRGTSPTQTKGYRNSKLETRNSKTAQPSVQATKDTQSASKKGK